MTREGKEEELDGCCRVEDTDENMLLREETVSQT